MAVENHKINRRQRLHKRPVLSAIILMLITAAMASGWTAYAIQGKKYAGMVRELENKTTSLESELDRLREKYGNFEGSAVEAAGEQYLFARAFEALTAIKNKDMKKLSGFIHPDKGVRFSPYGYIDTSKHLIFTSSQVSGLLRDKTEYTWGDYDGTGEPIKLMFEGYYKKFVYDVDFANAKIIGNNTVVGHGNTLINIPEVYPAAVFIEYHFPGFDPQYNGMDWRSLRLIFEEKDGIWYIVGIVHDQWTI